MSPAMFARCDAFGMFLSFRRPLWNRTWTQFARPWPPPCAWRTLRARWSRDTTNPKLKSGLIVANSNSWLLWPYLVMLIKVCVYLLHRSSKELLMTPVVVSRNEKERVQIESSVNSVRISIAIKQASVCVCVCVCVCACVLWDTLRYRVFLFS